MHETLIKENPRFNYYALFGEDNPLRNNADLYQAAIDEFSLLDYQHASLNTILKSAQMPKSTFYYQFGDKLGLYLAVMDMIQQSKMDFFRHRLHQVKADDEIFATIRSLARETMDFMFLDERMYRFSNLILRTNPQNAALFAKYFPYDINNVFGPLLQSASAAGLIKSQYPAAFIANIMSVILANIDRLVTKKTKEEAYESLTLVFDILENGIRAPQG